jgi:ribonuclease VapC
VTALIPVVLDASALLAFFRDELGTDLVRMAMLSGASISTVNYAEVLTRLAERGGSIATLVRRVEEAGIPPNLLTVVPFTEGDAEAAASLRSTTRHLGLSLGDRACLALGLRMGRPVLTADRAWATLAVGVEVRLIRH